MPPGRRKGVIEKRRRRRRVKGVIQTRPQPDWKLLGAMYSPMVFEQVLCKRCICKINKNLQGVAEQIWEELELPQVLEDTSLEDLLACLPDPDLSG